MTDRHVHDDLSRALDGELDDSERAKFEAHLAACGECAAAYAELQRAVGALRGLGAPVLAAGEVDALVGAALGPDGAQARRSGASLWVTHAAVLAAGLLFGLIIAGRWSSAPPEPVTQTVEVVREVPVEVEVPVRVEVPVERVVIERVEVPVEVERIVREPYAVPSPLQPRFDEVLRIAAAVADVAGRGAQAIESAVDAAVASAAWRDGPSYGAVVADGSAAGASALAAEGIDERIDVAAAPRVPVVVRRDGARVQILTRGGPEDVVPALLDALESDDGAVVAAALDRLEALRAELEDGEPAALLAAVGAPERSIARPGGIRGLFGAGRGRTTKERDPAAAWRLWWEGRAR